MNERVTIYMEDKRIKERIEGYADDRDVSFSRAVLELAEAGLNFHDRFGSLNVELIAERMKRLEDGSEWRKRMDEMEKFFGVGKFSKKGR